MFTMTRIGSWNESVRKKYDSVNLQPNTSAHSMIEAVCKLQLIELHDAENEWELIGGRVNRGDVEHGPSSEMATTPLSTVADHIIAAVSFVFKAVPVHGDVDDPNVVEVNEKVEKRTAFIVVEKHEALWSGNLNKAFLQARVSMIRARPSGPQNS
ncbi:hypothetical protein BU17DRAFT_59954 [Hysterangium stoloniferum]|nr:hypothetical protein BU17DRAFT_59954 [Hysterangium stoloniferum]